jgi:hypothetical protein
MAESAIIPALLDKITEGGSAVEFVAAAENLLGEKWQNGQSVS